MSGASEIVLWLEEEMSYFQTIYAAELPHRAVAVYMYLRDRLAGYRHHCPGAAALPQHRAAGVE